MPLTREFGRLARELSSHLNAEELVVAPYAGNAPDCFAALPAAEQASTLASLSAYVGIIRDVVQAGHRMTNDREMVARALATFSLTPEEGLLDRLVSGDVLEIYRWPAQRQVFCNFRFHEVCTYSIDELYCRPWYELYRRRQDVTDAIVRILTAMYESPTPRAVESATEVHEIVETRGERVRAVARHRLIAPLFDASGRMTAILAAAEPLWIERRDEL